jgi:acyl carrier protein
MQASRLEVERVTLELLGEELGVDPAELQKQLAKLGPELPIDSLILVEVLVKVEKRFKVRVPEDKASAAMMRSIYDFTSLIVGLMEDQEVEED